MRKQTLDLTTFNNKTYFPVIRIKGICRWGTNRWSKLLEKKGLRLYIFLRLVTKNHEDTVQESSTLDYLFNHIL